MLIQRRDRSRRGAGAPIGRISTRWNASRLSRHLVLVAHVSGKADAMTAFWATCFFWLRLAHAVVYLLAVPYVRTVIFTLGFIAVVGIFWEVIK